MTIDCDKLERIISQFTSQVGGTSTCIGVINGMQVQLHIIPDEPDEDEVMVVNEKWVCVTSDA